MKRLLALCLLAPLAGCDLLQEALDSFDTSIEGTIVYAGETPADVMFTLYSVTDNLDAFDVEYCYDLDGEVVYADCYGRVKLRQLANALDIPEVDLKDNGNFTLSGISPDLGYILLAEGSDENMVCTTSIAGFDQDSKVVTQGSALTLSLEGGLDAFQVNGKMRIYCEAIPTEPIAPAPDVVVLPELPEPDVEEEVIDEEGDIAEPVESAWASFTATDKLGDTVYADASKAGAEADVECGDAFPAVITVRGTVADPTVTSAFIRIQMGTGDKAVYTTMETSIRDGEVSQPISLSGGYAVVQLDSTDKLDGFGESNPISFCSPDDPPAQELLVLTSWDSDDTDIDLHIMSDAGDEVAYYALEQDWGNLDIDDTDGFGPETFSSKPDASGNSYRVAINYYSDHGNGPTAVKVRAVYYDASTGEVCDVTAENIMAANDWWGPATFGPGLDCPGGNSDTTGTSTGTK
jgi:hypothetical protein